MTNLHHSTWMLDSTTSELPMRITHSFPPRGIVAKVLNNSQNTEVRAINLKSDISVVSGGKMTFFSLSSYNICPDQFIVSLWSFQETFNSKHNKD